MRTTAIIAVFCTTALTASVTAAAPEKGAQVISYADLDLTRATDVARLQHRVARALESVCGSYAGADPEEAGEIAQCRTGAASVAKTNVALLIERARGMQLAGSR